tara:strand:+ start:1811 stop:2698 length:888 start_codon:yes stop_codon:yes gene_type:complete
MNKISNYKTEICISLIGIIIIHLFFIPQAFRGEFIDAEKASKFGSFIGGYVGTLFALISVILLYNTLKDQKQTSELEKFENRFFLLLSLHKNNTEEIILEKENGKKIFVHFIREFRSVFKKVSQEFDNSTPIKDKINISYLFFFYGTGHNSRRILKSELSNYDNIKIDKIIKELSKDRKQNKENGKKRKFKYYGGHQSRLGHYYRHLFQTVNYVHNREINIDKKEYIKILRAQLSNHEQAIFALNSLSSIGKEWNELSLINEYEMIKNIPNKFFNPNNEFDLKVLFPEITFEFEE